MKVLAWEQAKHVVRLNQLMVFLGPGLGTGKTCGEIKPVNGISYH
jgi:hypothetical protein